MSECTGYVLQLDLVFCNSEYLELHELYEKEMQSAACKIDFDLWLTRHFDINLCCHIAGGREVTYSY